MAAAAVREDESGQLWCPEGHLVGTRKQFGGGNLLLPCKQCATYTGGRTRIYAFPDPYWRQRFTGRAS